jgi:hypothetical protein
VGARADAIERHIETTRTELGGNLQELESRVHALEARVKEAIDWRIQFERHTAKILGVAFALGVLLALPFGGRRRRRWR